MVVWLNNYNYIQDQDKGYTGPDKVKKIVSGGRYTTKNYINLLKTGILKTNSLPLEFRTLVYGTKNAYAVSDDCKKIVVVKSATEYRIYNLINNLWIESILFSFSGTNLSSVSISGNGEKIAFGDTGNNQVLLTDGNGTPLIMLNNTGVTTPDSFGEVVRLNYDGSIVYVSNFSTGTDGGILKIKIDENDRTYIANSTLGFGWNMDLCESYVIVLADGVNSTDNVFIYETSTFTLFQSINLSTIQPPSAIGYVKTVSIEQINNSIIFVVGIPGSFITILFNFDYTYNTFTYFSTNSTDVPTSLGTGISTTNYNGSFLTATSDLVNGTVYIDQISPNGVNLINFTQETPENIGYDITFKTSNVNRVLLAFSAQISGYLYIYNYPSVLLKPNQVGSILDGPTASIPD